MVSDAQLSTEIQNAGFVATEGNSGRSVRVTDEDAAKL